MLKDRIRTLRGNVSREKFAEIVESSESTIKSWEAGKTEPKLKDILTIAKATGCDPARLAFGDSYELENTEQAELTASILSLDGKELSIAKELISALALKSHARRLS